MSKEKDLSENLDECRQQLHELLDGEKDFSRPDIVEQSNKLDKYILEYMSHINKRDT